MHRISRFSCQLEKYYNYIESNYAKDKKYIVLCPNYKKREIENQIENEVDAIIVCGTTGESATMSEEEQLKLLATDGKLVKRPLVVGDDFVLTGFKEVEWNEKML